MEDGLAEQERFRPTFRGPGFCSMLISGGDVTPRRRLWGWVNELQDFIPMGRAENTIPTYSKSQKSCFAPVKN